MVWVPIYGADRGASPDEHPGAAVTTVAARIRSGGILMLLRSRGEETVVCPVGVRRLALPVLVEDRKLGDLRVANLLLLGAFLGDAGSIRSRSVLEELAITLGKKRPEIPEIHRQAVVVGKK